MFYNRPISKRAFDLRDLWKHIASIWRNNEGFAENFFRILSYLIPWVPGLGWGVFILEKIASFFGYGLSAFGAFIDKLVGWSPNPNLNISKENFTTSIKKSLTSLFQPKSASTEEELIKLAWFGGLLKLVSAIPKLIRLLWEAVKFLLLAFGFTKVGDIYSSIAETKGLPGEVMLEEFKKEDENSELLSEKQFEGLEGLVKDPTKMIKPLTTLV